jgi:hypothetical protein
MGITHPFYVQEGSSKLNGLSAAPQDLIDISLYKYGQNPSTSTFNSSSTWIHHCETLTTVNIPLFQLNFYFKLVSNTTQGLLYRER